MLKSGWEEPESHSSTSGGFTKLEDDAGGVGVTDLGRLSIEEQKMRERQFKAILEAKPTEAQLQPIGEPSLKAAKVLGEARIATKSPIGLNKIFGYDAGMLDAEAVRRANEEYIAEKRKRRETMHRAVEASLGKPSKQQLEYPQAARKRPVAIKAMQLLGDEDLALLAKQQLPEDSRPQPKALKVFGSASELAPLKARRVLGSSDDDGEARALADKHWIEEMSKRATDYTKEVVARKPDESLQRIPMDQGPVPQKALQIFGDEGLRRTSLRTLKGNTKVPPKAIRVLGEAGLAGRKAEALCGTTEEAHSKPPTSPILASFRKKSVCAISAIAI